VRFDPEPTRVNYPYAFTYQACLAYYVHRCMPTEPQVSPRLNPYFKSLIHSLIAAFAFLFLQIACLNHERYHGLSGGGIQKKPAYRYRGCIEFYLSYAFWTLLCIDQVGDYGDDADRAKYCNMDFVRFHRYVFADVLKVMILAEPQYAGCTEIADAVFQTAGILPGLREPEPAEQIERISEAFCNFYKNHIKPIFYRHLVGLMPDPRLLLHEDNQANLILYNKQRLAFDMIIEHDSRVQVYHLTENGIVGEVATFIDRIGIQGVLDRWHDMLQLAPARTLRLLESFVDNQKLQEYRNIQLSMRPDSFQPMITPEAAETIYIMCNALELPYEPTCKRELDLLRIAPTCSPMRSIWRLLLLGAFGPPREAEVPA
jgi:hypothetical protein